MHRNSSEDQSGIQLRERLEREIFVLQRNSEAGVKSK